MKEEVKEENPRLTLEGRYADAFQVGQSAYKFVLDFGQYEQEEEMTNFHTRVILAPDDAGRFLGILKQSISEYENQFGRINPDG